MLRLNPQLQRVFYLHLIHLKLMNNTKRVIVYVDGFNFYFGLKSKAWRKFYWLDFVKFFESLLKPHQTLECVLYFSARPHDKDKADRQDKLFSANKLNPKFILQLGKYLKKKETCRKCGNTYDKFEEKETDVRIATTIVRDVVLDRCDISIIVSADSDLKPAIELIRDYKQSHKIYTYFPPNRHSLDLQQKSDGTLKLENHFLKFQNAVLNDSVFLPNGYEIKKPKSWD